VKDVWSPCPKWLGRVARPTSCKVTVLVNVKKEGIKI